MKTRKPIAAAIGVALTSVPLVAVAQDDDSAHHDIDEIVVKASPLNRTIEEIAQPTAIIYGTELQQKASTSIGETVSQEPGLSSTFYGPIASRPVIRGQSGERIRVLTDGLDTLDAGSLSEDHQTTAEALLAERIEIIRGPATLLYGSGAAGGLVNVIDMRIPEQRNEKPFSAGVALGADSATGKQDAAVRAQFGTGSVAFSADFFARSTDNIEIPGFAESELFRAMEEEEHEEHEEGEEHEEHEEEEAFGEVENTDGETYGGSIGASLIGERGFLGISVSTFDSEYGIPGHHHHHEEEHEEGEEEEEHEHEEEEDVRLDLEQTRVDIKGEYDIGGSVLESVRFRAAVNDYYHAELEGDEVGTFYDIQGTDVRVELRHAPWGALEGAVGIQYHRNEIETDEESDEAFFPSSTTDRTSLFIYESLAVSDAFVVEGSARYEDQSISGASITDDYDRDSFGTSLGAVWRPADDFRLAVSVSSTQRHPTATELYANGPHVAVQRYERGSVTQGRGILKREDSTNIDVSVGGDTGMLQWSITGFVNAVDDFILLRATDEEIDELQVYNFDQTDAEFKGIEAEAVLQILDEDDGYAHVRVFTDYVHGEEEATGDNLPLMPPRRWGLGVHGGWNAFDAGIDAVWASDQERIAENELPTGGYALLNASLSYTFAESGLYMFLRGTNLLDEEIRQHSSPLKDQVPLPGRSVQFGLRYEF